MAFALVGDPNVDEPPVARAVIAGGAESMSRGQYWLPSMRWGARIAWRCVRL